MRYNPIKSMIRCRDGVSAVEFALVCPVFILLLLAVIQFSFIFYTINTAQQSGWLIARQVAIGTITAANAPGLARSRLPSWAQTAATIPPVVLSNGVYTVKMTIPLVNASPVNFIASTLGTASLTTNATFLSEVN